MHQNGVGNQGLLESRPREVRRTGPHEIATGRLLGLEEWGGDLREIWDDLPIVLAFINEPLHLFSMGLLRHLHDGFNLAGTGPDLVVHHHVPQTFHLLGSEGAHPRVQFQIGLSQCFEEPSQMSQRVGPRVAVHDNVVDVPDREDPLHTTQEHVHHPLENSRARSETEGQSEVFALAIGGYEASFKAILFLNLYLVESWNISITEKYRFPLKDARISSVRSGGCCGIMTCLLISL